MREISNICVRIESDVKQKAEFILKKLGIPASDAINMFYKQIILTGGIPFDLKIPNFVDASRLTKEELDIELKKGLDDIDSGRVKSADFVFE